MVVDDNIEAKLIIARQLDSFGFNVLGANSGMEAIEIIKKGIFQPGLIVMDYLMPEIDGIEATRQIRMLKNDQPIPEILMISAYGKEEIKNEAKAASIHYFLDKPVNPSHLFDTILEMFSVKTPITHMIKAKTNDYKEKLKKIRCGPQK